MEYRSDELVIKFPPFQTPHTKRSILATIASLFDPNGLASPATLPAKQFQARIWKQQLQWDDILPEELSSECQAMSQSWEDSSFTIPRKCFPMKSSESIQLHTFSDASITALGYAIYGRHTVTGQTGLLFARALVIPTSLTKSTKDGVAKPFSIPRLELQALALAAPGTCYSTIKELHENQRHVNHVMDRLVYIHTLAANCQ